MFEENWLLFILILLIVFAAGDGISDTEAAVLIFTVLALVLKECGKLDDFFSFCRDDTESAIESETTNQPQC